jgi:serine/threonine-protein kinase
MFDNRYEIIRRLGSGGMADVFLARDTHLGRNVAIKILHKNFARDEEFVTRFRQEAQAAAGLNHPHIVSIYDRGEADDSYYIAMEYLEGKSLKELIGEKGRLGNREAIDIAAQILQGLQFAHEHNVIHRDIKPHNIVINGRGQVKVTDFGIARAGTSTHMTETGSIIGTAQYLSPEQAKGRAVEKSSDLYSLGVVLYEMLTGRVPFEGENPVAVALKHLSDMPVPPQALVPDIPDNLNNVVMRALAKDPIDRYRSAEEFLADLEKCRRDMAVEAFVPIDTQKTSVLRPGAAAMGAAGAGAAGRTAVRRAPAPSAARKKSGSKWWIWALLLLLAFVALAAGAYFMVLAQPPSVSVPNVVGQSQEAAESAITAARLKPVIDAEELSDTVPVGAVIRQNPEGGTRIKEDGTVRLVISGGSNRVAVPELTNQTASYAESKLRELGLNAERQPDVFSETVPEGSIIDQDPKAGAQVQKGSTVKFVVSRGPQPVKEVGVPNLVGLNVTDAQARLEQAKLIIGVVTEQSSTTIPKGQVISQNPGSGDKVEEGSAVDVVISKGVTKVSVPPVVNDLQAAAESAISAAGLVPAVSTQPTADNSKWGLVKSSSPSAGTLVDEGSTVTITVYVEP